MQLKTTCRFTCCCWYAILYSDDFTFFAITAAISARPTRNNMTIFLYLPNFFPSYVKRIELLKFVNRHHTERRRLLSKVYCCM